MILIDRIVTLRSRSPCGERGLKFTGSVLAKRVLPSLPVRGAWIEMRILHNSSQIAFLSLPVRGAWIEISF